jgi:hypothetical protein
MPDSAKNIAAKPAPSRRRIHVFVMVLIIGAASAAPPGFDRHMRLFGSGEASAAGHQGGGQGGGRGPNGGHDGLGCTRFCH